MTDKLDQYKRLQDRADKLRREADRAEGGLAQMMGRLESDYGVTTLKAAKALLVELEQQATDDADAYATEMDAFEDKWGKVLEEYT